jgi:uncharacterized zinc-type alcohol dehydrogenase-like protein
MLRSTGYAAYAAKGPLDPFDFDRRDPGEEDVVMDVLYCGICHSDLHNVDEGAGTRTYPLVPGHEIIGQVRSVGRKVGKFRIGDTVAIGCMIDSCRHCSKCQAGRENLCDEKPTYTYGGVDRKTGLMNYGGYSNNYVVNHDFLLSVPKSLDLAPAAPLLCAGITVYAPLRRWVRPGQRIGIVGMGGLGHVAIKVARALGVEVTVFTTSENKIEDALSFGAHEALVSTDTKQLSRFKNSLDFILDTVSAQHDINLFLDLLKVEGVMCLLGVPHELFGLAPKSIIAGHKALVGSVIGGISETQEMLNFCGEHDIAATIELMPARNINKAYDRLRKNDVRYRFVLDMKAN